MAIKINAQVTGYGSQPSNAQALVVVTVQFRWAIGGADVYGPRAKRPR
jgi:hypothetical protein